MSNKIFITPGPSQIYPGLESFMQDAIKEDICCISHRSSAYKEIHKNAVQNLKTIANLPDDYDIYFLGSATEAWERIFNNFVEKDSFHFVNGSFSSKFHQYGTGSGLNSTKVAVGHGEGFNKEHFDQIPTNSELIALTHNETSAGVQTPESDIHAVSDANPNSLIAVDMVSSFPYPQLDFNKVDTALFSVQKCMGLPAGLGVWFVNKKCRAKFNQMLEAGKQMNPHHDITELHKRASTHQTPSTPNILGIYLLERVTRVMLEKGIDVIRKETETKFDLLNHAIQNTPFLDFGVKNENHRSRTVVVANTDITPNDLNKSLAASDLFIGAGYGNHKEDQIRIANFPAISVETMEKLVSTFKHFL